MPKRSGKPPADPNVAAFRAVQSLTDGLGKPSEAPEPPPRVKNEAAQALGKLGGLKGGRARMDSMTPEQRSELAKKAAAKRWGKAESE